METATIEELQELGFTTAADLVKKASEKKKKLAIAYEHFRFVRPEKIEEFRFKLRENTEIKRIAFSTTYQTLAIVSIEDYDDVPPAFVLRDLRLAKEKGCFDHFQVAYIKDVEEVKVPDPILFGRVNDCEDYFFISQWDNDCKIEDILKPNEG